MSQPHIKEEPFEFRGVLTARSMGIKLFEPVSFFLELQTLKQGIIRIICAEKNLPPEIKCGNCYIFRNLTKMEVEDLGDHWRFHQYSSAEKVDFNPLLDCELVDPHLSSVKAKVVSSCEEGAIYLLDNGKILVLSFIETICFCPRFGEGDDIEVINAHFVTNTNGHEYVVVCIRSQVLVRSKNSIPEKSLDTHSHFNKVVAAFAFNIQYLMWAYDAMNTILSCVSWEFLEKRGLSPSSLFFVDILVKLLSLNAATVEPYRCVPRKWNPLKEFFSEPHECSTLRGRLETPPLPISLKDFIEKKRRSAKSCQEELEALDPEAGDRPLLGYLEQPTNGDRPRLRDASGSEAIVVFVGDKADSKDDFSSLLGKVVFINKTVVILQRLCNPGKSEIENRLYLLLTMDDVRPISCGIK